MKKAVSIILALTLALFALCACGKSESAGRSSATALEGTWKVKELPDSMKNYTSVTMNIGAGKFTYWLADKKTTKITEGRYRATGDKSMIMYPETLSEINNSTKTTINERKLESSDSEKQQGNAALQDDGTLRMGIGSFYLNFVRA